MNQVIKRNSGATLHPAMIKQGPNMHEQGAKMAAYPDVFAPVFMTVPGGYVMPMLDERSPGDDHILSAALKKLTHLWYVCRPCNLSSQPRWQHHALQVAPLVPDTLSEPMLHWARVARELRGTIVNVVHGDPTFENIMAYDGQPVWIDPSTRPMPLEAEFDAAKLMQSYFGYGGAQPEERVIMFIRDQNLRVPLIGYYLMTHLVRLYKVQPQARAWAVNIAKTLETRMEVLQCK